jgi:hypothetical protein
MKKFHYSAPDLVFLDDSTSTFSTEGFSALALTSGTGMPKSWESKIPARLKGHPAWKGEHFP